MATRELFGRSFEFAICAYRYARAKKLTRWQSLLAAVRMFRNIWTAHW